MNGHNIWNQTHDTRFQEPSSANDLSPDALIARLNGLSTSPKYTQFLTALDGPQVSQPYSEYPETSTTNYSFHLPLELQGGVSSISSRRPSFAAEQSYTHTLQSSSLQGLGAYQPTTAPSQFSLEMFAHNNNFQNGNGNSISSNGNNSALLNFRSRRPSIQINSTYSSEPQHNQPQQQQQQQQHNSVQRHNYKKNTSAFFSPQHQNTSVSAQHSQHPQQQNGTGFLELDNGLLLQGNVIITSPQLQQTFATTKNYFSTDPAQELYDHLCNQCHTNPYIQRVVINLKKLNNMFSLIKPLVLVLTKSGKYEILSTPINSNILLQKHDVVIVDGDRGKDLVYILDPSISLDVAILINYLKKRQHSKSISYGGTHNNNGVSGISNTVHDLVKGQGILDEETQFQIPTKQVLRFATFQEINNLRFKLVEEIKSLKTSLLKISNQPMLTGNLTILNSEYQFDQKKLTFFYYSTQRLDFRNLIKELFKIYKTRIWLCAVPKPTGEMTVELNSEVGFESCKIDDFHVRNFRVTMQELINTQ